MDIAIDAAVATPSHIFIILIDAGISLRPINAKCPFFSNPLLKILRPSSYIVWMP